MYYLYAYMYFYILKLAANFLIKQKYHFKLALCGESEGIQIKRKFILSEFELDWLHCTLNLELV